MWPFTPTDSGLSAILQRGSLAACCTRGRPPHLVSVLVPVASPWPSLLGLCKVFQISGLSWSPFLRQSLWLIFLWLFIENILILELGKIIKCDCHERLLHSGERQMVGCGDGQTPEVPGAESLSQFQVLRRQSGRGEGLRSQGKCLGAWGPGHQ